MQPRWERERERKREIQERVRSNHILDSKFSQLLYLSN